MWYSFFVFFIGFLYPFYIIRIENYLFFIEKYNAISTLPKSTLTNLSTCSQIRQLLKFLKIICIFLWTSCQICQLFTILKKKVIFSTSWQIWKLVEKNVNLIFRSFKKKNIIFLTSWQKLYFFNFKMKKVDKFEN